MIRKIRHYVWRTKINLRYIIYTRLLKMDIHPSARISSDAKLDATYPKGIHIGEESYIGGGYRFYS